MAEGKRDAAAEVLKALAHPIRLGVVELLGEGEKTVTELYSALECSQPLMSHQLTVLRNRGLIEIRREGSLKYCSLRDRRILRLFECLNSHLEEITEPTERKGA